MTIPTTWSLINLDRQLVARSLVDLHRSLTPGDQVDVTVDAAADLADLFEGAGFELVESSSTTRVRRLRSLPDTVGLHPRILVCGLNPSPASADAGIGFARPGNRFWPAALAAGLVSRDRDPDHALDHHGVAMTDLVKRTTTRADELNADEYDRGLARIERLAGRIEPGVICFVGLAGWRAAVDRKAQAGPQERHLGGAPVYLMPSTSGLNAHARLPDLVAHLQGAMATITPPTGARAGRGHAPRP